MASVLYLACSSCLQNPEGTHSWRCSTGWHMCHHYGRCCCHKHSSLLNSLEGECKMLCGWTMAEIASSVKWVVGCINLGRIPVSAPNLLPWILKHPVPGTVPLLAMKSAMSTSRLSIRKSRIQPTKCRFRTGKLSGRSGTPPNNSGPVRSRDLGRQNGNYSEDNDHGNVDQGPLMREKLWII